MTVTITSELTRRFAAQADINIDSLPDGTSVGWKSVHPDLRSGHDRNFYWPASGECAEPAAADAEPTNSGCGPGLHVALTALGARRSGVRLGTVLVVAWTAADEIQRTDDKVRLRRCDVLGVADATRADLTGADLVGANLTSANLTRADLYGAHLNGANLTSANLTRADLYGAHLNGAHLNGAKLAGADLTDADLARANLTDANLNGAYLNGAYLGGAYLARADLRGAYLRGANLRGANLVGANLYGAYLVGAVSDRWTRWPEGFDADAAGVTAR